MPAPGHWPLVAALQRAARPHHPLPGRHPDGEAARCSRWSRSSACATGIRRFELVYVGPILDAGGGRGPAPRCCPAIRGRATWARCRTIACPHSSSRPTWCSTARSPRAAWPTPCSRRSRSAARCSPSDIAGNRSLIEDGVTGLPLRLGGGAGREGRSPAAGSRPPRPARGGRPRARHARFGADREIDGYLAAYARLAPVSAERAARSLLPQRVNRDAAVFRARFARVSGVARVTLSEIPAARASEWRKNGQVVDGRWNAPL